LSARNLKNAVQRARTQDLWRVIYALGIPEVGESTAKILANKFGDFAAIRSLPHWKLESVDGIGAETAKQIRRFFDNPKTAAAIDDLLSEITILKPEIRNQKSEILSGKKIVITGTLSRPRDEIRAMLEELGAVVSGSVSAKTDILLAGENAGSKLADAKKFGVEIWSEIDMIEKIK